MYSSHPKFDKNFIDSLYSNQKDFNELNSKEDNDMSSTKKKDKDKDKKNKNQS